MKRHIKLLILSLSLSCLYGILDITSSIAINQFTQFLGYLSLIVGFIGIVLLLYTLYIWPLPKNKLLCSTIISFICIAFVLIYTIIIFIVNHDYTFNLVLINLVIFISNIVSLVLLFRLLSSKSNIIKIIITIASIILYIIPMLIHINDTINYALYYICFCISYILLLSNLLVIYLEKKQISNINK